MKIALGGGRNRGGPGQTGSVLAVVVLFILVVMIGLAGYLSLGSYRYRSAMRSESWNMAISVAEAGIEEAFAQLFQVVGTTNLLDGRVLTNAAAFSGFAQCFANASASFQINGWQGTSNGYTKTRYLGSNYYTAIIFTNDPPKLLAHGSVLILGTSNQFLTRHVQITTSNQLMFARAMLTSTTITGQGNNVRVDSFDSGDPLYSTFGFYDPAKRRDKGDIACNAQVAGCIDVGNGDVYGKAATGPGGTVNTGVNGGVGSSTWFASGHSGIEPGASRDDLNVVIPDVVSPYTGGTFPTLNPPPYQSVDYSYILTNGDYVLNGLSLSGNSAMLVTGTARLRVTGTISLSGNAYIRILTNASLRIYMEGTSASLGGNGVMNVSGNAANFQYFGTTNNTSVSIGGNGTFIGTVYAPRADMSLSGGGNTVTDFVGSTVTKSATLNGHFNFHYDERLKGLYNLGWHVNQWNEM